MKAQIQKLKHWISSINNDSKETKHQALEPQRGKGVFVKFAQINPLPALWFKDTQLSGYLSGIGHTFDFKGTASHLTDQQSLSNKPTSLDLSFQSDLVKEANVTVAVDVRSDQKLSLAFDVKEYRLDQKPLSGSFTIDKALLDTQGNISSINDKLTGKINADLNSVSLKTSGDTFTKYPAVEQALSDEDHVTATIELEGTIDSPEVVINSNLDSIFNNVLKKVVDSQLATYKTQVTEKIDAMLQQELSNSNASQSELLGLGGEISGTKDIFNDLIGKL
jgi:uncharacterized protein (TIGR03545 family)